MDAQQRDVFHRYRVVRDLPAALVESRFGVDCRVVFYVPAPGSPISSMSSPTARINAIALLLVTGPGFTR